MIESEFTPGDDFSDGGGPASIRNLDIDSFLRIQDEEPENWQQFWRSNGAGGKDNGAAAAAMIASLSDVQIKRQEHIYEFIATESNHCQVLKAVQQIFVKGMYEYFNMSKDTVEEIFPCLEQLIDLHLNFLRQLRMRQNEQPIVETIADILIQQFSGNVQIDIL